MAACQLPKLDVRVRFPLPAPIGSQQPRSGEGKARPARLAPYGWKATLSMSVTFLPDRSPLLARFGCQRMRVRWRKPRLRRPALRWSSLTVSPGTLSGARCGSPPKALRNKAIAAGQELPEYSASLTCSIHVTLEPSSASWIAIWVIPVSGAAPCQWRSSGSNQTTSPGRIS